MATDQRTIEFIAEQVQGAGDIRYRKMFGEYALYCNDKVVGFVCDDQLFIKPTSISNNFLDDSHLAPAYPGSKDYYKVPEDKWDEREWLTELIQQTASKLPLPKQKKKIA